MSTATLPREARRNIVAFFAAGKEAKEVSQDPTSGYSKTWVNEGGRKALRIVNMPVFRSGTFRDSYGIQHTWDDIHMDQMVQHFDLLRTRSLLEHLPVRKGHPGFLTTPAQATDEIIGYHTALRVARMKNPVDGIEYNYLFADYDIIDPVAADKVDAGLWRNMSAEVGHWFTNAEAEYWPVYQGVAYCDFSAVEGLKNFSSANGVGSTFSLMTETENPVAGEPNGTPVAVPTPPAGVPTPPVPPQNGAPPPQQQAGAPAPQVVAFEFTLAGGRKVSDFAAVQAHIADLESKTAAYEKTESERREGVRKAFVKSLAGDSETGVPGKLLANQLEPTEKFALSLTDEQYTAWQSQWEAVPASPVFAGQQMGGGTQFQQNQQTPPQGGGQPGQAAQQSEIDTAKAIIVNFQRTGMKPDQIKETPSFKKLVAAGQAPQL
jgi:hypothetical protein